MNNIKESMVVVDYESGTSSIHAIMTSSEYDSLRRSEKRGDVRIRKYRDLHLRRA